MRPGPVQLRESRRGAIPRSSLLLSITGQGPLLEVGTPRSAAPGNEIPGTLTSIQIRHHGLMFQSLDAWGKAGSRSDGVFEETAEAALFRSSPGVTYNRSVRTTPRGEDAEECIIAQAARDPKALRDRGRGREYP
jgi:hypothetical protein